MDKLASFIQQTQYFTPVEINDFYRICPSYRHVWKSLIFSLVPSDNRNTRSTCPTSVFTVIGQTLMSRPDGMEIYFLKQIRHIWPHMQICYRVIFDGNFIAGQKSAIGGWFCRLKLKTLVPQHNMTTNFLWRSYET